MAGVSDEPTKALAPGHIVVKVRVKTIHGWEQRKALIDSGATSNFVSQHCVKELDLIPTSTTPRSDVYMLDGQRLRGHGIHQLGLRVLDSSGNELEATESFLAVGITCYDFVLGMPWLERQNPTINWSTRTLKHNTTPSCELVPARAFASYINGSEGQSRAVYIAQCSEATPLTVMFATNPGAEAMNPPAEYSTFVDIFSEEAANQLPQHGPQDHAIEVEPGQQPPFGPLYSLSEVELVVLREYIQKNLANGFIQPSTSPAGAPILFVKRKDGALRLCVDYRGLNAVTRKNRYPLPLIDEALDRLTRARIYTKLDIRAAYSMIRIKAGDEWKTAFRTRYGHYEYRILPFGLSNAPATFQAYINSSLSDLLDQTCIVYLDDILVFSEDPAEHKQHVTEVLERLQRHRLFVKLEKCEFSTSKVEFLGYIISPEGVSMDPDRVDTVVNWPEPKSTRDIQVFLGFTNFYRRFVGNFSKISAPLSNLLRKRAPKGFPLSTEARTAFEQLKAAFTKSPVLQHFNPAAPIRVETDASGFAIAAILTQADHEGAWHPVAYWSRKMDAAELNYETHDAELLAIVMAFRQWRRYLESSHKQVLVLADHANLQYFMSTKELSRRQARWAERLSAFDLRIEYRPGPKNPADGPSRRPDYAGTEGSSQPAHDSALLRILQQRIGHSTSIVMPDTPESLLTPSPGFMTQLAVPKGQESSASRLEDPLAGTGFLGHFVPRQALYGAAETAYTNETPPALLECLRTSLGADRTAIRVRLELESAQSAGAMPVPGPSHRWVKAWREHEGVLYHHDKVYIPPDESVRLEVMRIHHDNPLAGHFGYARTLELLRRKVYWPSMAKYTKEYCRTCDVCQRVKAPRHKPYGQLQALPPPSRSWGDITMDFVTGLPPSKAARTVYDAILVVVDRLTKMAHYIPTHKDLDAPGLAETILREVIAHHGIPDSIVTDRGSVFTSEYWSTLCYYMRIRRKLSTAFHPQTDGQTERQNQTMEQYLRSYINYQQDDWATLLPMAEFAYNDAKHATTGVSPFMAVYGYTPRFEDSLPPSPKGRHARSATEQAVFMDQLHKMLAKQITIASNYQAKYYDKRHLPQEFRVNDLVWLIAKNIRTSRPSRKLDYRRHGPFTVQGIVGSQAYRLALPDNYAKVHNVFHVSLLEPAHMNTISGRIQEEPAPMVLEEDDIQWRVETLLDSKRSCRKLYYLVRWEGFSIDKDSWIPADDIAEDLKQEFHRQYPTHPGGLEPNSPSQNGPLARRRPPAQLRGQGKRRGRGQRLR